MTRRRALYERFGVDEYWLLDPRRDAIRIFARQAGRFTTVAEFTRDADDALTSPMFPGLRVALLEVFPARERI